MAKSVAQDLLVSFGPNFLEDHARRLVSDPKIALTEVIANSWDAGADKVEITWPKESRPDPIEISDNGLGMTHDQFINRWRQLNYNRTKEQGDDVTFPPENKSSHRKAFGRNGKGRHSMFCFSDQYYVETWRDGKANLFLVKKTAGIIAQPYNISHKKQFAKKGHGTKVSTELGRHYLDMYTIRDLIGSKFVTDPTFSVYVNGERVEFTDLEHLSDIQEVKIPKLGVVKVSQVDTQKTSKTSRPHGVAWWVNRRLVGEPSWKNFDEDVIIDRRTVEAKRYTFVVEADVLANDVQEDWSDFRDTENVTAVREAVGNHIRQRIADLMREIHKERKRLAIEDNVDNLSELSSESRYYIGQALEKVQEVVPSIPQKVLSATASVLSNLEKSRFGYSLLEELAKLEPDDLDSLYEILDKWSIQEIRIILGELERRLKLIEKLEELIENPSSDELHDIQPLFERGLWIFGPEYESIYFTSNRTLLNVIGNLLKDQLITPLKNPKRRPDFVVLPDSTVGIYASDAFDDRSEVKGFDKILIVELKRGGSTITLNERRQGEDYALEIRKSGKIQESTKIVVFVLGTEVAHEVNADLFQGNTTVSARAYSVVLRQAHARTFHLLEKIREVKSEELSDPDVESVMTSPRQSGLFN